MIGITIASNVLAVTTASVGARSDIWLSWESSRIIDSTGPPPSTLCLPRATREVEASLGGPVDVERHLHGDRRRVHRQGLPAERLGLGRPALPVGDLGLGVEVIGRGLHLVVPALGDQELLAVAGQAGTQPAGLGGG